MPETMSGYIPRDFIQQLVNRIDIVELIDSYVPLTKAGNNFKACCPFHNEKTPSFSVSPEKQFYHCFGCGASGSAISFLMEYEHLEFPEAIEKLATTIGIEVPRNQPSSPIQQISQDSYQLMEKVSRHYQKQLHNHAHALRYLQQRKVDKHSPFQLGFATANWDDLSKAFPADRKTLLQLGMLSRSKNEQHLYDRFRNRIMFPIHDFQGRIVAFGGRALDDSEPKYLNSPESAIFHKSTELYGLYAARKSIKKASCVLVVEGYLDVIALAQSGIANVVATMGTATTARHIQRLTRLTSDLTFCFDGDTAGKAAAIRALKVSLPLLKDGIQISFMMLPQGQDPDTLIHTRGTPAVQKLMAEAIPLPTFLIEYVISQVNLQRIDGQARLATIAKPLLQEIPDGVLKQNITHKLVMVSGVQQHHFVSSLRTQRVKKPVIGMTPMRRAISLLLQQPDLANHIENHEKIATIRSPGNDILHKLIHYCRVDPVPSTAQLLEHYRQNEHFSALEKLATYDHMLDNVSIRNEFAAVISKLLLNEREQRIDELLRKAQTDSRGLDENEKQLLRKLYADNTTRSS